MTLPDCRPPAAVWLFPVFGHNAPKRAAKVEASNSAVSWLRKPLKSAMRGADGFTAMHLRSPAE
jgi:hypothetical protein